MNAITKPAVTVLTAAAANDAIAMRTLGGGKFVTAQLGNPSDVRWAPCATILLLQTEATYSGQQFTALYKKSNGLYYVALMVALHPQVWSDSVAPGEYGDGSNDALMYCTSARPWDMETMSSPYINSAADAEKIKWALEYHKNKIDQLPVIEEFDRNGKIN